MLSDDEAMGRLRALKRKLEEAENLYDRFGDERVNSRSQEIQAEIDALPAHVRQKYDVELKLQLLTRAVEDTLVARAAQFLPEVDDLWAAVQTMLERRDTPETPAEKPVVRLLDELRPLPASDEDVKKAVLAAAALESFKQPTRGERTGALRMNPPHDYRHSLQRQVREFLAKAAKEGTTRAGLPPLDDSNALVALVRAWERETPEEARGGTYWTRYHRQAILSNVNVLRRLGLSDAEIDALIAEAYERSR